LLLLTAALLPLTAEAAGATITEYTGLTAASQRESPPAPTAPSGSRSLTLALSARCRPLGRQRSTTGP
jgi:hypothetical protein